MDVDLDSLRVQAGANIIRLIGQCDPQAERAWLIRQVWELCECFVTVGATTLLMEGRPQSFFLSLCRAAENWRRLLEHLKARGELPPPASRLLPLLGAVLAGHGNLAVALARASRADWQQTEEYAEEYAWASALQALVLEADGGVEGVEAALGALRRVAREECWPDLVAALLSRDAMAFEQAFDAAWQVHHERTLQTARLVTTPVHWLGTHRYLWFEGLALLRMARQRQLEFLPLHRRYCPPLAWTHMTANYSGDWVVQLA